VPSFRLLAACLTLLSLAACQPAEQASTPPMPAAPSLPPTNAVVQLGAFAHLQGWSADDQRPALLAFRRSCVRPSPLAASARVAMQPGDLAPICAAASQVDARDLAATRRFFETSFVPVAVQRGDAQPGLFTGYFEPELRASLKRDAKYRYPIYLKPNDLPASPTTPFLTRTQIEAGGLSGRNLELAYADSLINVFELQVQGSGRLLLPGGQVMRVGFAGHNGQPYTAIGRILQEHGAGKDDVANWPAIKAWLARNPGKATETMQRNARFIFFRELTGEGPVGSMGVALTPERSLAVDPSLVPYGAPVWISTFNPGPQPDSLGPPLRRLMVAQDTGGAIKGPVRGDIFWGAGDRAEDIAGRLKSPGMWWVLLPRASADRLGKLEAAMAWLFLGIAGLCEIGWAIGLKYTEGFTRLWPSVFTVLAMIVSVLLLGWALKSLPVGTAYAVWTGIGAVGTAILGIVLFGDPATVARLACIGLIVAGIVGLKLVTPA
jgi:membrane-bound lytic murein transglycosylase A